jgi:Helix-turn-helix domain
LGYDPVADVPSTDRIEVVDVTRKASHIDANDLVQRYVAGESEKALAEAFGVSRQPIRRLLIESGVPIRGRSEAMYARMANTSPEDRAKLSDAAHAAVRGVPKSAEFLLARAAGVERRGASYGNVSAAEQILMKTLEAQGLKVTPQKAIGPYNVDLATGTVAVEVFGGGWHRTKSHGERLRYILDAGWDMIYIWVDGRHFPLAAGAAEYVIAHAEIRDRDPAAPRGYWVIRGGGQFVAKGSADGDDLPDIIPNSSRPNVPPAKVPFGECHCGCGKRTAVASVARNGRAAGEPSRYISGHNNSR